MLAGLTNVTFEFGARTIVEDATWHIQPGERIGLIGYTMIDLTVFLNRISSSGSRESGDRHRSDLLIKLPNTKRPHMIMCKTVFAY